MTLDRRGEASSSIIETNVIESSNEEGRVTSCSDAFDVLAAFVSVPRGPVTLLTVCRPG